MSTLVERLRAEAERLSGSSIRNGCPDCGIAANVAEEAADALSARLTPPAEVVRYDLTAQHSEVSGYTTYRVEKAADGEWVRYEDHAAALAAERAARIEAEEALRRIVEECGAHPNAQAANRIVVIALTALGVIDQPKGDAA